MSPIEHHVARGEVIAPVDVSPARPRTLAGGHALPDRAERSLASRCRPLSPLRQGRRREAACDGPDVSVAAELEAEGRRAERRGGYDVASQAYQRAADLTGHEQQRARRLFSAARAAYTAGSVERARALLDEVTLIAADPVLCADIDRLHGRIQVVLGSAVDAHWVFVQAARRVAPHDQDRAAELAASAGVLRRYGADSGTSLPARAVRVDLTDADSVRTRCLRLLLRADMLEAEQDWGGALEALRDALEVGLGTEARDVWADLADTALQLGDEVAHRRYGGAMLSAARADGAVMEVIDALHHACVSRFAAGDWPAVRRSAEDAVARARGIGQPALAAAPLAWLALLAALQGSEDYDARLDAAEDTFTHDQPGMLEGRVADLLRWAKGTRAHSAGAASDSFHHFDQMRDPVLTRMAAVARITAATQAHEHARATAWTSQIVAFADATALPWALAMAEHGRAALGNAEEAPGCYERALVHHQQAGRRYEEACTHLAYGEHLRRTGQRVRARRHLNKALATFRDLHARPLVARATRELRASGETARQRDLSTAVRLTPTELHIVQLVSQGMSNKEVAAQCWISPRTVAFHLRNVFTKTGVTSRGGLAQLDLG